MTASRLKAKSCSAAKPPPIVSPAMLPPSGAAAAITFANLSWGSPRRSVRAALAADAFALVAQTPDDFYRGRFDGDGVTVECVFTPADELVFVRVIFDAPFGLAQLDAATSQAYGRPAACSGGRTRCRWERGDSTVTAIATGDPYAPPGQASLEYSAGGDLAARYTEQTNDTERDNDRSGMGSRHIP
jgi:hypothetical protein